MGQHQRTRRAAVREHLDACSGSFAARAAAAREGECGFHLVLDLRGARAQQEERHEQRERDRRRVQRMDRRRQRRGQDPQRRQRLPPVRSDDQEERGGDRDYCFHGWVLLVGGVGR